MTKKEIELKAKKLQDYYKHLSLKQLIEIVSYTYVPAKDERMSKHIEQLNSELDVVQPIMETGNRLNIVDAIKTARGISRDILLNSLTPSAPQTSNNVALPRNMTNEEIDIYLKNLYDEGQINASERDRILSQVEKENTDGVDENSEE